MSNIKCKKCGSINSSSAKFCSSCGEPLNKELKCPKCGAKIKSNDKFCPSCGCKLNNEVAEKPSKVTKPMSNFDLNKILNVVSLCVLSAAMILFTIGIFGAAFKMCLNGTTVENGEIGLTFYFRDLFKEIQNTSSTKYGRVVAFTHVMSFMVYLFMLLGFIYILVKFIQAIAKEIKNQTYDIDCTFFLKKMCIFVIPQLILVMLFFNSFTKETVDYVTNTLEMKYSWGSILLIISLCLTFVGTIIKDYYKNKDNAPQFVIRKVVFFAALFVVFFGFRASFTAANGGLSSGSNAPAILQIALVYDLSGRSCYALSIIVILLMIVNAILIIRNLTINDNSVASIARYAISAGIFVLVGILSKVALYDYAVGMAERYGATVVKDTTTFSGYCILGIVITSCLAVLTGVARTLNKNK